MAPARRAVRRRRASSFFSWVLLLPPPTRLYMLWGEWVVLVSGPCCSLVRHVCHLFGLLVSSLPACLCLFLVSVGAEVVKLSSSSSSLSPPRSSLSALPASSMVVVVVIIGRHGRRR